MAENSRATSEPVLISLGQQGESFDAGHRLADGLPAALRPSQNRAYFPTFLAGSLVLHLAVLVALIWAEHAPRFKSDTQQEIPVELVPDPDASSAAKDKGKPAGSAAEVKPGTVGKPSASKPVETPKPPAASKPTPPAPAAGKPEPKPAIPKPPAPLAKPPAPPPKPEPKPAAPQPPPPAVQKPLPPSPPLPKAPPPQLLPPKPPEAVRPPQAAPQSLPLAPPPAPPAAPVTKPPASTGPVGTPTGQPQGLMQDNSRAVAVPQPSDDGDDIVSYQTLVFGMLELKKDFPEDAKRRGVFGTAQVYFELNDDGSVKSEKLLRSSGDAALDVESLALVQRAAPFPKPPAGAQKVFAADITFPAPK